MCFCVWSPRMFLSVCVEYTFNCGCWIMVPWALRPRQNNEGCLFAPLPSSSSPPLLLLFLPSSSTVDSLLNWLLHSQWCWLPMSESLSVPPTARYDWWLGGPLQLQLASQPPPPLYRNIQGTRSSRCLPGPPRAGNTLQLTQSCNQIHVFLWM